MKKLLFFAIITLNLPVTAQSSYNSITEELNRTLTDTLLRGINYSLSFAKDSTGELNINPYKNNLIEGNPLYLKVISALKNNNCMDVGIYSLHVYWDLYSSKVYTSIGKDRTYQKGLFVNYDNYFASPKKGIFELQKIIISDIKRNYDEITHKNLKWNRPIEIFVDEEGKATFLETNDLVNLLDSAKLITWNPGLYYARPRAGIYNIQLAKNILQAGKLKDIIHAHIQISRVYALNNRFNDNIVRFIQGINKLPHGKIVVSFVLNPSGIGFENPIIHEGNIDEAHSFITWIIANQPDKERFYWSEYPRAGRYYFYMQ